MSEPYTFDITPSALKDLDGIMEYISVQLCAKESALQLLNEIEAAIDLACLHPYAASKVNDSALSRKGYRKLMVKNYIVFYIPNDSERVLHVMRVMYFARDYMKEL